MAIVIVGLGNPGNEYAKTRHNAGRMVVELLAKQEGFEPFVLKKGAMAMITEGKFGKENVTLALPEVFMNQSGKTVSALVPAGGRSASGGKAAKNLVVIHDDLDLPLGVLKMVFARGSGGHKGVESIMRAIKTEEFVRIRIGISGTGKKNQAKKVSGEEKVVKHVIGKFSPKEEPTLKKALKKAANAAKLFATDGLAIATQEANTK